MQQSSIDIPGPLSADNETVITALETAALFGSKGDTQEAMRWLRRAAESAGEAGDDLRALSLSRVVADLGEELSARHQLTVPAPPPEPSVLPPPASVSAPPRPSSAVPSASTPPPLPRASTPPPSVRASYPTPPSSRPGLGLVAPTAREAGDHPAPAPAAEPRNDGTPHATRVAVHKSSGAHGVFEVRVLRDGEAAAAGDSEAFLVMIDPRSTLLSS